MRDMRTCGTIALVALANGEPHGNPCFHQCIEVTVPL